MPPNPDQFAQLQSPRVESVLNSSKIRILQPSTNAAVSGLQGKFKKRLCVPRRQPLYGVRAADFGYGPYSGAAGVAGGPSHLRGPTIGRALPGSRLGAAYPGTGEAEAPVESCFGCPEPCTRRDNPPKQR